MAMRHPRLRYENLHSLPRGHVDDENMLYFGFGDGGVELLAIKWVYCN